MDDDELDPSNLGTQEHWDQVYETEIENFNHNGDFGEVWFGTQTVKRVVTWIKNKNLSKESYFVDIGCGNGYTCIKLAEEGFTNIYGIDYSPPAVRLADSIAKQKGLLINYSVVDVMDKTQFNEIKFNVAIDKGTYDAIALNPDDAKMKRFLYKEFLVRILMSDGLFIITSCNWSFDELVQFYTSDNEFELVEEIKAPVTMMFGGKTGSTTTTLIFKRI